MFSEQAVYQSPRQLAEKWTSPPPPRERLPASAFSRRTAAWKITMADRSIHADPAAGKLANRDFS